MAPFWSPPAAGDHYCRVLSAEKRRVIKRNAVMRGYCMWDPRTFRFRNFVAIALAAIITAAVLRHTLHVYGGINREEIRWHALTAVFIVISAFGARVLVKRMRRR